MRRRMAAFCLVSTACLTAAGSWGPYRGANTNQRRTEQDIRELSAWGANLLRANFAFSPLMSKQPPYPLNQEMFRYLDSLLDWCEKYRIAVVIDPHTSPGLARDTTTSPADEFWKDFAWHEHLVRLWEAIARRYKDRGAVIAGYDLLNEPSVPDPNAAGTPADWNLLVRKLVKAIRAVDPRHTIIVETPRFRAPALLRVPAVARYMEYLGPPLDANMVYSPHMYQPGEYTHQEVSQNWNKPVAYPGWIGGQLWDRTALEEVLAPIAEFQKKHRVPIFIGEFSAVRWRPDANVWLEDAIQIFEEHGWSWAYHAFRSADPWDAERSNENRADKQRLQSTPRIELLKKYFLRNAEAPRNGKLAVRILDESASPSPARIYLTQSGGRSYAPEGAVVYQRSREDASETHFVPPAGRFELELPAGLYRLEIERGKEYLPVADAIEVTEGGRVERTYRLQRWVRMQDLGWYSGDMHPHRNLRDMALLMEADDLNVALPITRWRVGEREITEDPDLKAFLARANAQGVVAAQTGRWFTVLNEELEPPVAALLVSRLGRERTELEYPLTHYGRLARQRRAVADSEKATSLELPALAALGACDLVGLANNHFWRSGYYRGAWGAWPDHMLRPYPPTCAGFATAGFELYYALLNLGFPLKLSAGSASGVHPVPLGWSRIYAHVEGAFTPENWFRAVTAGRSFVTTGPMLLLKVNGREPGEEIRGAAFPLTASIELTMLSPRPVSSAEVVVNGVAHPVKLSPAASRPHVYRGELRLRLATSSWLAARWLEARERGCDLAHTAPVYFWDRQIPVPIPRAEAEYLLQRVERLAEAAASASGNPAVRGRTLEQLREAAEVYRRKLQQAR